ncbi:hypothetical protein [Chroococcidiopsis sp. SAG 2025]|uniref:hypothetical protein n=1 Tax=Chroococcidiopsis sp. SAG 2025 TaxID=171389 RepID=UPI002937496A|nr:hypothetical protein [Chroococcidiopsis sp. SAG 2025]
MGGGRVSHKWVVSRLGGGEWVVETYSAFLNGGYLSGLHLSSHRCQVEQPLNTKNNELRLGLCSYGGVEARGLNMA